MYFGRHHIGHWPPSMISIMDLGITRNFHAWETTHGVADQGLVTDIEGCDPKCGVIKEA